jgi:hypothetical protein
VLALVLQAVLVDVRMGVNVVAVAMRVVVVELLVAVLGARVLVHGPARVRDLC